ncbi:myo-inositol-1(or 4)-monophosphatase [Bacillus oleivorans]|uniref:inositol-phosphate phosphatase n=1 Tax=Bacillus oleivorans TaxID=1448271 RepID=A0A285D0D0_9BACI|nr:inositol monophosphatase family protein [Bacillus oleivorans]SNX73260.1 myo-inositol-1(or 4)-monophosphatase [Bacillus oleivorans]
MTNWINIAQAAKEWVLEAGQRIRDSLNEELLIETKSDANDLVTNIDKDTEKFFIEKIKQYNLEFKIMGEEGFGDRIVSLDGVIWILDPIDGTMNFVHQKRNFAISLAVYENGEGRLGIIYDVMADDFYHVIPGSGAFLNDIRLNTLKDVTLEKAIIGLNATWITPNKRIDYQILSPLVKTVRGTRSYGAAAIELAYVATGRLDGYITMRLNPWDYAAGKLLIEEVGGKTSNLKGEPLSLLNPSSLLVGGPTVYDEIRENYLKDYQGK